jgi:hypothetical protein
MKCKNCGTEINLTISGLPNDICWECANEVDKRKTLSFNLSKYKNKNSLNNTKKDKKC